MLEIIFYKNLFFKKECMDAKVLYIKKNSIWKKNYIYIEKSYTQKKILQNKLMHK